MLAKFSPCTPSRRTGRAKLHLLSNRGRSVVNFTPTAALLPLPPAQNPCNHQIGRVDDLEKNISCPCPDLTPGSCSP